MKLGFAAIDGRTVGVRALLWLVLGAAAFQWGPYAAITQGGRVALIEEAPHYSADRAMRQLERLGDSGRVGYVRFQIVDAVLATLTAWVALSAMHWGCARAAFRTSVRRGMIITPWALLALEGMENTLLALSASTYPEVPGGLLVVAPCATALKFVLFLAMLLSVLVCVAGALWQRYRQPRKR